MNWKQFGLIGVLIWIVADIMDRQEEAAEIRREAFEAGRNWKPLQVGDVLKTKIGDVEITDGPFDNYDDLAKAGRKRSKQK
jgi:hypothetical protein